MEPVATHAGIWCKVELLHQQHKLEHNIEMRTSINLDEDVYEFASQYAAGRGLTLSGAINEVFRRVTAPSDESPFVTLPNGLTVFASRGRPITSEMVKAMQEDEDES
jgi:hypothetical protein